MSAVIKLLALGCALWVGAFAVYDLPMRKLEAAVSKHAPRNAG